MEISVVIPAFNSEAFIGEAIKSALAQSIKVAEIVVVDDGSNDRTCNVVSFFAGKISLVKQTNHGSGSARNKGILNSKGEYVAFLDSDDFWAENHIELLLKALSGNPAAALAYSGKIWVNKKGDPLSGSPGQTEFPSGWIFSRLLENNYISSTSCVIAKRDILVLNRGFRTDARIGVNEDYELWLRIAANNQVVSSARPTVYYRRHEGNLTLQSARYAIGHLESVRSGAKLVADDKIDAQNQPGLIDLDKRLRRAYQDAIKATFWCCDYKASRTLLLQGLWEGIFDFRIALIGILSFFPTRLVNSLKTLKKFLHKYE